MAESLLLPVVRGVAGKAADSLVQSVTGMWGVDEDRGKLERHLLAVHRKLVDAEVKSETDPTIKRWMKDLKAVAYEADDVLDDFQYEALRREAQIGKSTTGKVLSYFTHHSPIVFRLAMSWKLRSVLKKINELVVEMNTFGLAENRAEVPQVLYRQTHSGLDDYSEIFGRDDDKEVVMKLLLDQQDQQKVQVLPIIGMGGLGKTTLVKMVYNDIRVQRHFELKMWHCVSENFEAIALVKSIIELATIGRCNLPDNIELLRARLQEVIGRKRFLLVLDDVWNEDKRKWEDDLKPLLCSVGEPGSVIVVTSRSQQVASIMGTLQPHALACLSEDNSWELFSKKAFSKGVKERAELVIIGRRIVEKCKGLPLALKTIGGLMSSKQQVQEWEAIEESNVADHDRGKDDILSILKLSYRHLSSEMKQCFAFCAVFPKDYEMDKDKLIQLWMANGFIKEEGTMDLAQKGELIFHDLVWRSFLQDVKLKQLYFFGTKCESIGCKMHDLMHDLAKDVTDECATIEELIQQKASIKDVRHMQKLIAELKESGSVLKGRASLRTLLDPLTSHKNCKELKLTSLRVLCCYNPSIIHSKVINAKHLRYLDLSGCNIVRLPDSICLVYNLQSLRLNDCIKLKHLPEDMVTLRKLIHLYLFGCTSLERMPPNVSRLKNLHTLTTFVVDTEVGRGIEELKHLRHLANNLELYNLRKIKSGQNAKEGNFQQKQNLTALFLYWGREESYMPEDEISNDEEVLESLAPHSELQILEVHGYGGLEISQWMRDSQMFLCLRKLRISNCPRCKDLPVVWLSVSLEYLSLCNMGSLTTLQQRSIKVDAEAYNTPVQFFPKLKEMYLSKLPNLERWAERSPGEPNSLVMFPQLEELRIYRCPKLASVPVCPVLKNLEIGGRCSLPFSSLAHLTTLSGLEYKVEGTVSMSMPLGSWPSLVRLEVGWLANMMVMPLEDQQNQSQTSLENLRTLKLNGPQCFVTAPSLSKPHLGLWECFAFLEDLNIARCNELVCWPVDELRCLVRLRSLIIWDCANLEGKGSSSEEILPLPQMERLYIRGCGSLLEIPKLPASLEHLEMYDCKSLVALPSNLGNLAKLRDLVMWGCSGLKTLPDGMDGLTSLERLLVRECPGMEKFPEGLLQRLPTLQLLQIDGCPDLERRCREGGGYFHLVSSIPRKYIPAVEPNTNKKFLKRLLPSC